MRSLFALLCLPLLANGQMTLVDVPPGAFRDPELRKLDIQAGLDGQTAQVTVSHSFFNGNAARLEGQFLFPLPQEAHVERISMDVNGVDTPAELLDAAKARTIYEEIVRRKRDPGLFEWAGSSLLRCRIFPLEPHAEMRVRVTFRVPLVQSSYALTFHQRLSPGTATSLAVQVRAPQGERVFSPTHSLSWQGSPLDRSCRLDLPAGWTGPDRLELHLPRAPGQAAYALTHRMDGQGYLWVHLDPALLLGQDGKKVQAQPLDIAFLLDSSGSMSGAKMEQARKALEFCLGQLRPQDRFALVRFSTMAESFAPHWLPAHGAELDRARSFVSSLQAIGGTNYEDALAAASAFAPAPDRPCILLFITDGKPTVGQTDPQALLDQAKGLARSRMFTLGVGNEVNTLFLDRLADQGRGARSYVLEHEDLELKLSELVQKVQYPLLTELRVSQQGVRVRDLEPGKLPDLFYGDALTLLGRYDGPGEWTVKVSGKYGASWLERSFTFRLAEHEAGNGFIPRLWAQRRIGYFLEQIRLNGENSELVDEITRLARRYCIVTPYTSFLIVEDEPAQARSDSERNGRERERREATPEMQALRSSEGSASMVASKAVQDMKSAQQPAAPKARGETAHQWVAGAAFYQKAGVWQQADWPGQGGSTPPVGAGKAVQQLVFLSAEYLAFLRAHPELAPVLALGDRVQFLFQGQAYEVVAN
jgi:Ca-activated chloride channel family protein